MAPGRALPRVAGERGWYRGYRAIGPSLDRGAGFLVLAEPPIVRTRAGVPHPRPLSTKWRGECPGGTVDRTRGAVETVRGGVDVNERRRSGSGVQKPPRAVVEVARESRRAPTRGEALLWERLRMRQLCGRKFRRQHAIGRFIVDFYCAEERLAVEVDGPIHAGQHRHDAERQRAIESLGVRFLRVADTLVQSDIDAALDRIAASFSARPAEQHSPSPPGGEGAGG
jgi:very-short-patch-repair endonuclease